MVVVGYNKINGTLELFEENNGQIYHKWQIKPDLRWHNRWEPLSDMGVICENCTIQNFDVGDNRSGTLEVFAQAGTRNDYPIIYHIWQKTPAGAWHTKWEGLDSFPPNTRLYDPVVARNEPKGTLEVFAVGVTQATYSNIYHIWQLNADGAWHTKWESLGSPQRQILGPVKVIRNEPKGTLEVFAIAYDAGISPQLYHIWQLEPSGRWHDKWESLGSPAEGKGISSFSVGRNMNGTLEVFGISSNMVFHKWQKSASGPWYESWQSLGSPLNGARLPVNPAVGYNKFDGTLEVFVLAVDPTSGDDIVYHRWQQSASGAWNPGWQSLGSPPGIPNAGELTSYRAPIVGQNEDGRLEVFMVSVSSSSQQLHLYHRWQQQKQDVKAPRPWNPDWQSLEYPSYIPVFADGTLVREISKSETYLIYNRKKMLVDDNKTDIDLATAMDLDLANVRSVADGSLSSIPIVKLESASLTPPSLVFPPDNQGSKFFLDVAGSIKLKTQGKEIRIVEIRGWLRKILDFPNGTDPDWHYYLDVDPEWADSKGIDLNQILKVGNIINNDILVEMNRRIRTYSPYAILALPSIHVELNGWRDNNEELQKFNATRPERERFHYTCVPKPLDWTTSIPRDDSYGTVWPYNPLNHHLGEDQYLPPGIHPPGIPDNAPYVSISGSILTDNPHVDTAWFKTELIKLYGENTLLPPLDSKYNTQEAEANAVSQIWGGGREAKDPTHPARWTEIHPPDIIKLFPYKEPKETLRGIAVVARNGFIDGTLIVGETRSFNVDIYPPGPRPPSSRIEVKELVGPETNFSTIVEGNATKSGARITTYSDRVNVYVKVQGQGAWGAPGTFKAIYRVRWSLQ